MDKIIPSIAIEKRSFTSLSWRTVWLCTPLTGKLTMASVAKCTSCSIFTVKSGCLTHTFYTKPVRFSAKSPSSLSANNIGKTTVAAYPMTTPSSRQFTLPAVLKAEIKKRRLNISRSFKLIRNKTLPPTAELSNPIL